MNLNQLFCDFANGILSRTQHLTEDSIRYYFFSCMQRQDLELNHYVMELPYAEMNNKNTGDVQMNCISSLKKSSKGLKQELDLYYKSDEIICAEFKFHRGKGRLTARAGEIFNDMRRLQFITSSSVSHIHRLFVYITDEEMHKYFLKESSTQSISAYRSNLRDFYSRGGHFDYDTSSGKGTFYNKANESFCSSNSTNINVTSVLLFSLSSYTHKFMNNCHISIFEVSPIVNNTNAESTIECKK